MELSQLQKLGSEIDDRYAELGRQKGYKERNPLFYTSCLTTDLGELTEFILAKEKYRDGTDLDQKISHELSDCLWVVLMLAKHLDIDLEATYVQTMNSIKKRQAEGTAG